MTGRHSFACSLTWPSSYSFLNTGYFTNKKGKQIPKQELNLLMGFFFETFCCFVRCVFCLTLKHASRGTWLVSDAGAIVEIEQSIMSQSVLNIVDHFLLLKFRQSKYGSSLRCCNMLLVYHFHFRLFSRPWLLCVQPICSTLRQHAWMELDSKERATLVDHFLADGIQHLAIIFTFLPVPRDFFKGHLDKGPQWEVNVVDIAWPWQCKDCKGISFSILFHFSLRNG